MNNKLVSQKQFSATVFAAILSPLMRLVPRCAASLAGKGAWLSVVPALGVLLLLAVLMGALVRGMRPGEGMAGLILRICGSAAGRILLVLFSACFLFYAGFILRSGAERLAAAVYRQSGTDPFILVMLALCIPAASGTVRAAVRTGVVLRGVLLAVLGVAAILAASNISLSNLFPLHLYDAPYIARGSLPIIAVGGAAAPFAFLYAYVDPPEKPVRSLLPPLIILLCAAALLCFETVGAYGAALTSRLAHPFFTIIRDVSMFGTPQRFEASVIVSWVFADYIMCVMLLHCAQESLCVCFSRPRTEPPPLFGFRNGRWLIWPMAAAVYLCARLPGASAQEFSLWSERLVPLIGTGLVFGGYFLLWLVGKLRKTL